MRLQIQTKPPLPWTSGTICFGRCGFELTAGNALFARLSEEVVGEGVSGPLPKFGGTGPAGKGCASVLNTTAKAKENQRFYQSFCLYAGVERTVIDTNVVRVVESEEPIGGGALGFRNIDA